MSLTSMLFCLELGQNRGANSRNVELVRFMYDEVAPVMRMADELARLPAANLNMFRLNPMSSLGEAEVHSTDKEFRVRMEMPYFKPEDVKISSENGRLIVHAKHAEKEDQHGYVEREFTRVFKLPKDVDSKCVSATMNDQGILNFKIPKKAIEEQKETTIPVNYTED